MATSSFFYGGSTAPEQNTVDELIDALNQKIAAADEDRVAAELAKAQAEAAADSSESSATSAGTSATNAASSASSAASSASTAADASRLTVGTVTTGTPGSSASASITGAAGSQVLSLTIPAGADGTDGVDGTDGADGAAATIAVGTVTTGDPGTPAAVTNVGTSSAAVFNFTIPKGDTGTGGGGGGSGDVVGPASSVDNSIPRFDGTTGKLLQGSGVKVSDNGTLQINTTVVDLVSTGGGISLTENGTEMFSIVISTTEGNIYSDRPLFVGSEGSAIVFHGLSGGQAEELEIDAPNGAYFNGGVFSDQFLGSGVGELYLDGNTGGKIYTNTLTGDRADLQYYGLNHKFYTEVSGVDTELLRFSNTGALGLSGANYGTSGQLLSSQGSSSAPAWQSLKTINGSSLLGSGDLTVSATAAIGYVIDGGGAAITTGLLPNSLRIPFACTINSVTLLADQTGSIVVDIWKDTYANYPPVVADSICGSAKPTLSSAVKSEDTTLIGWTTSIAAGDVLLFNVDSATTVQNVTLILKVTKT